MKVFKSVFSLVCVVMAVTAITFAPRAQAEDPIATELSTSDAEDWVGLWKITTEIMDREFILFLNIADVDGKMGATLDMEGNPEPRAFTSLGKTDNGIEMDGELLFMGSIKVEVNMNLQFDDENVITGIVKNPGGFFESPLVGEPLTQTELDSVQGQRRAPTEAQIRVGKKTVRLAFSGLEKDSIEWDQLQNTKEGEIFQFTLHRAMKIYTDVDLTHGDTTIKKENFAPDYPGVYSVWLKKVSGGWSLVFNSQPDIWGSRHNPEFDVYEVPMTVSTVDGDPADTWRVEMEKDGENANLNMFWGDQQWSTTLEIVQ